MQLHLFVESLWSYREARPTTKNGLHTWNMRQERFQCTQVCFKVHGVFTFAIRSRIIVKMTLEHLTRWMQAAVGSQCGMKTPNTWSNTYLHHKSLGCSNVHSFVRPRRLLEPQLKEAERGAGRPRANGGAKRCEKKTGHKSCKAHPMTIRVSRQPQCIMRHILESSEAVASMYSVGVFGTKMLV